MGRRDANDIAREAGPDGVRRAFDLSAGYPPDAGNGHHRDAEEPSPREPRFKLTAFRDLRLGETALYLVKGILPRVGLAVIWGPPKCGKSFITFDMLLHVALNRRYRGRRVMPGPVVYCALEGAEGFKARAEAFRIRNLAGAGEAFPFYVVATALSLVADHKALVESIRAQLGDTPVAVCIDTLNRSLAGSESDDKDMAAYVRAADAIRDAFNCAVVIVHHCGIDGTRPRGHTSLTGAADAQLAVKRDTDGNVVLTVEFMKDGPEGETIVSRLDTVEVGTDQDGDAITSCVVVEADGAAKPAKKRVTGQTKIALDLLNRALVDAGETPPGGGQIPDGVRAVKASLWRSYCDAGSISEGDNPEAQKKAFKRSAKKLQEAGIIGGWGPWVWLI